MKLSFDEKNRNYIEIKKSQTDTVIIILSSQDSKDRLKNIINSVEISREQFKELIKDIDI